MTVPAVEPAAGPWAPLDLGDLLRRLLAAAVTTRRARSWWRSTGVARRGSPRWPTGWSRRRRRRDCATVVVHTDDVAWNESFFGWAELLRRGRPGLRCAAVRRCGSSPRPGPRHGGAGALEVAAQARTWSSSKVSGPGAGNSPAFLDAVVWVQSDFPEAERRGIARDTALGVNGDADRTIAFWHEWMDREACGTSARTGRGNAPISSSRGPQLPPFGPGGGRRRDAQPVRSGNDGHRVARPTPTTWRTRRWIGGSAASSAAVGTSNCARHHSWSSEGHERTCESGVLGCRPPHPHGLRRRGRGRGTPRRRSAPGAIPTGGAARRVPRGSRTRSPGRRRPRAPRPARPVRISRPSRVSR